MSSVLWDDNLLCLNVLQELVGICCTLGILALINLCNGVCSTRIFRRQLVRFPIFLTIRDLCEYASCNWTICGKILRTTWSLFSVASFGFFVAHTMQHPKQIIFQRTNLDDILIYIDLCFNVYFIIFFIIRFIGTNDKWGFMLSTNTWMEVLTIGPSVIAVIGGKKKQLVFGFLRALRLAGLKDLLFVIGIVRRSQLKTLTNILVNIICFWCVFAGVVYQTENMTKFYIFNGWLICTDSEQGLTGNIDFFRSLYFLLVTASSVGYGDISPGTYATKVAIIIFVTLAVSFFATVMPDIYAVCSVPQNFGNRSFYIGAGERHIVYCGSSKLNMLKSFFWNFYYNDGKITNGTLRVCFLQSSQLSEQVTWFLRSFCGRITVVFGNPTDSDCLLENCRLKRTDAVILSSEAGLRSDFEADRLNYVRTIGLKMCAPYCRTIVQIKSMFHKQSFRALPLWRTRQETPQALPPDAVLCDSQILLGLMGVNSLAPGFATLLINLVSYRESQVMQNDLKMSSWRSAYTEGIQAKFYCVSFNAKHRDRPFKALAMDAYMNYGVLLIGVRMIDKLTGILTGVINPSFDNTFTINPSTMRAFVVSRDAKSAANFSSCVGSTAGFRGILVHASDNKVYRSGSGDYNIARGENKSCLNEQSQQIKATQDCELEKNSTLKAGNHKMEYTAVGATVELDNEDATLDDNSNSDNPPPLVHVLREARETPVPLLAASAASPGHEEERQVEDWYHENVDSVCETPRELHAAEHLVEPLEDITGTLHWAPNRPCRIFSVADAKTIEFRRHIVVVVIGTLNHPLGLSSFVLPLRNYSIPASQLSDIVILGDARFIEQNEWRGIKNFPFIYVVDGNGVCPLHLLYCRAHTATAMVVFNLKDRVDSLDPFLDDKLTLQCTENLRGLGAKDCHVTSELFYSPNAYCFSDPSERFADISAADVMDTQSFAEGLVVSSPNLTGLLASIFFCPEGLPFLESVIYGSNQPSIDDYLSLDFCIPSSLSRGPSSERSRVFNFRVLQLGAHDPPLCDLFKQFDCKEMKWEDLLIGCLDKFDLMCLGIYRKRAQPRRKDSKAESTGGGGWFVFTFPEASTIIDQKDRVFCFAPPLNRHR